MLRIGMVGIALNCVEEHVHTEQENNGKDLIIGNREHDYAEDLV